MYHTIEFRVAGVATFQVPSGAAREEARAQAGGRDAHTQQLVIQRGTRMRAQIKPYVVESREGPIEVADLLLEDGSFSRAVRFGSFHFVDESRAK
jgi:hypothetical protein